jgi:hypothetical protein
MEHDREVKEQERCLNESLKRAKEMARHDEQARLAREADDSLVVTKACFPPYKNVLRYMMYKA